MYEIWLMMNIVWEWSLAQWPAVLALLLLLAGWAAAGLVRLLGARGFRWSGAALAALAGGAVGLWLWPALVGSSVSEMRYLVDWMVGLGMAGATALVGVLLALPWLGRRSG
jgi:hypothetical protein